MLPVVAAAPACEDQNAVAVSDVEELVRIQLSFQANRIQVHVANVAKLIFQTLRGFAQHHVWRPAGASNEHPLPVHSEKKGVVFVYFRRDFTDSKMSLHTIRNGVVQLKFQVERIEMR